MPKYEGPCAVSQAKLDELAHRIRTEHQAAQAAWSNALGHVLNAGDALIEVQDRGVSTNWKCWLRDNCFLAVSTAQLYMQLARHRAEVEAEMARLPALSLRAARRLIAAPTERTPKPKKSIPDLLTAWRAATDSERTHALADIPIDEFYAAMPSNWRTNIESRVIKLHVGGAEPLIKVTQILRKTLSLIKTATETPNIAPVVAASNEKEAIAGLRQLNVVLAAADLDLNEVAIVHSIVKARRRRAA
jgi:hypothetical protein